MKCKSIIEMSLWYMEKKLNTYKRKSFEIHINQCGNCNAAYELLKSNYNPGNASKPATQEIVDTIFSRIDKNRYKTETATGGLRRKWTVILVSILLLTSIAVNADTISKSLDELVSLIGRENNPKVLIQTPSRVESPEGITLKIYEKHKNEVYKAAENMKTGEFKELNFKWDGKDFVVRMGKTSGRLSLSVRDAASGRVITGDSLRQTLPNKASLKAEKLLQNLIANGYFVPVLEPMPTGYRLQEVFISGNRVNSLIYSTDNDGGYAVINMDSTVIKDDVFTKSLETINGYQAIYQEAELKGIQYGSITLYLGDEKRQKTMSITAEKSDSSSLNKYELISIVQDIKLYNEENNTDSRAKDIEVLIEKKAAFQTEDDEKYSIESVFNGEIFKEIKDPRVAGHLDEYKENIRNGQTEFVIDISEGVTLERFGRYPENNPRYFCSLKYKAGSFDEIKEYISIPLLMNKEIYKKSVFQQASCVYPDVNAYVFDGGVHYQFYPAAIPDEGIETCDKLTVDANAVRSDDRQLLAEYSITDIIVDRFTTINYSDAKTELVYDNTNHPYIVSKSTKYDITTISTIKEICEEYVEYVITIPNIAQNGTTSLELVNGLDYIR